MDAALTRYLAEEIAEVHAAGQISRREALVRLGKMGFGTVAASSLLAACASGGGEGTAIDPIATSPTTPPASGGTTATTTAASRVATQDITYPGQGTTLRGVFAPAASDKGAVLVIHENSGVSAFVRSMVGRLAGDGFTTLAVDLLSRAGGTAAVSSSDAAATLNMHSDTAVADMRSTLDELGRRQPGAKLGMCGFCFGGSQTWRMLESGETRLEAAIPCYGTPSGDNPSFSGARQASVLGVFAATDNRVNASRVVVESALQRDGLTHEVRTFPDVGHGFIRFFEDPSNAAYTQANLAYAAMTAWFTTHLR